MSLKNKTAPITTSDVGYAVPIELGEDVSAYTSFALRLKSPQDDSVKEVNCTINPDSDTSMILLLQSSTFNAPGTWIGQAKISQGSETVYGDEFEIEVKDILS